MMHYFFRFLILLSGLFLVDSCVSEHNYLKEIEIAYTTVDSITIESTDVVRFLSFDSLNHKFLFLERSKNNLILYDHNDRSTKSLSYLKESVPYMSDLIIAAHLSDDTLTVIGGSTVYQYLLSSDEVVFANKGLIARLPEGAERIVPYKDQSFISNLTPYHSIEKENFEAFSFVIYDSVGDYTNIFGNKMVPHTPDIRVLSDFDNVTDEIFHYKFPYDQLYKGTITDLMNGGELNQMNVDISFLNDHPYHNNIPYDIGDFPYIPLVFGMHLDQNYLFLQFADGGDKELNKYMDTYSLIIYNRKGKYLGMARLRSDLSRILTTIGTNQYLFGKNPNIEYKEKTVFDIVEISGLPDPN